MKIKTLRRTYDEVMALPRPKRGKPWKPTLLFRTLMRIASAPDLWATKFSYTRDKKSEPQGPCLILMNHSSFIDLKIATGILYPKPFGIVCTTDAMVGKGLLMKLLGCIPTQKFVADLGLIRDMKYMLHEKKTSVLLYPEAGYSFDGRATAMSEVMGGLVKMLGVPVLMIRTHNAFARDPLYNGLQNRKVKVSAEVTTLLTAEQVREKTAEELEAIVKEAFTFDNLAEQYERGVKITESFRADGLHRILYKCPACLSEGDMEGKGTHLTCRACGKSWYLNEDSRLEAADGVTEFPHIPDWYDWERAEVKKEIDRGEYRLDTPVQIGLMVDYKGLYMVGEGWLTHSREGFRLTGCKGKLNYEQKPLASHTLNADFYWYCIGDVIGIGNRDCLYYCFPKDVGGKIPPVAKARLATEEIYKIAMAERRRPAKGTGAADRDK
jgi:1-acyl-sn-glycerol-3-phosphate acyltransferase